MTDAEKAAAMARLRKADNRVRKHEAERKELAAAIVEARKTGWTPSEIDAVVDYDRNHVGRILKTAGLTAARTPKATQPE